LFPASLKQRGSRRGEFGSEPRSRRDRRPLQPVDRSTGSLGDLSRWFGRQSRRRGRCWREVSEEEKGKSQLDLERKKSTGRTAATNSSNEPAEEPIECEEVERSVDDLRRRTRRNSASVGDKKDCETHSSISSFFSEASISTTSFLRRFLWSSNSS